jgi:hypothetical protein
MTEQTKKEKPGPGAFDESGYLALQAGLLALNATFEAARSGEAGTGWAAAVREAKHRGLGILEGSKK